MSRIPLLHKDKPTPVSLTVKRLESVGGELFLGRGSRIPIIVLIVRMSPYLGIRNGRSHGGRCTDVERASRTASSHGYCFACFDLRMRCKLLCFFVSILFVLAFCVSIRYTGFPSFTGKRILPVGSSGTIDLI